MHQPPRAAIITPDYWPVDEAAIERHIHSPLAAELTVYGQSVEGRELRYIRKPCRNAQRLWIVAAVHGHEPGTTAACFNLMSVLHDGVDLKGKPWPELADLASQLELAIVPVANPDGRARCPDSFVGWSSEAIVPIGQSIDRDGRTVDLDRSSDPDGLPLNDIAFLGGLYNSHGRAFNHAVDSHTTHVAEAADLIQAMAEYPPHCCMDLHACSSNVIMMVRTLPDAFRQKVRAIDAATRGQISTLGHQYADILVGDAEPPDTGFVSYLRIVHDRFGALAFVYEGRQGFIDRPPHCDEADIVDDYLIAIRETMRVGVTQGFVP